MATHEEHLYYASTRLWPQRDVPVCWETAGDATEKAWVKQAIRGQRSWSSAGNINFVGWGACGTSTSGIHLKSGGAMVTSHLGMVNGTPTVITLDFGSSNYSRCNNNGLSREECIKTVAIHEFGHAIGYAHEQNRGNAPVDCGSSGPQGSNGDETFGPWDVDSIMAYCNFSSEQSALDRRGTERVYGPPFRDAPTLGDYNGDGRADLLCWDVLSGDVFMDLANTAGQFAGTDWNAGLSWCNATDTRRLFTDDFNGDGRDDMLCFDMDSGSVSIDYASTAGQFAGTDWSAALNWCNATDDRRLHVGDFNGDSRADLLCFDRSSGAEWIDYADASGHFGGTDWSAALAWCDATDNRRLHVGDFNGDGRDDLLCHDLGTGDEFIDYASTAGEFAGSNWSLAAGWCDFEGAAVFVGDFNGDGRDDLLCHSARGGSRWIDFADASGHFGSSDWSTSTSFCASNGDRLYVGDVNGDGRDDLTCHNVGTGTKSVDYANTSGQLAGTDWSLADGFCDVDSRDLH